MPAPPPRRGLPPPAPPRRLDGEMMAPEGAAPVQNPFISPAEPSVAAPSNPFLGAGATEPRIVTSAPAVVTAMPESAPRSSTGTALQSPPVSQLQPQLGAVSPSIKDPHSEFRKGSRLKTLLTVSAAAAVLFGLFYAFPGQDPAVGKQQKADGKAKAVIGTTFSPDIIVEPEVDLSAKMNEVKESGEAVPADRSAHSGSFAETFKTTAR